MYRHLLFIAFLLICVSVKAQSPDKINQRSKLDSLNMKQDSINSKVFAPKVKKAKIYHPDSTHSPQKAVMRSLYFPGLGQIYNRHGLWWRLPVLYGGLGLLVYNVYSNGKDYNMFLKESEWRAHGRPADPNSPTITDKFKNVIPSGEPLTYYNGQPLANVSDQTIYDYKDNLRRNRDLSIFGIVGVWGINMIDAYVEAKFIHSYTMDNNLSFKVSPSLMAPPTYASGFNTTLTPSLKITLLFR